MIELLKGGYISMPDRIAKGVWPHPPLVMKDLVEAVRNELDSLGWFPRQWVAPVSGEPVSEVGVIEKHQFGYVYRSARHHPTDPRLLAQTTEKRFVSAESAIRYYLKWNLNLPGDLDGWKVIE